MTDIQDTDPQDDDILLFEKLTDEIERLRAAMQEIHTFAGLNPDAIVTGTYIRQIWLMSRAALNPKDSKDD